MALTHVICPDQVKYPVVKCLAEGGCRMKDRCATRSYLKMATRERTWRGVPSTTQLLQGTMYAFLMLTKDYAVSPDDRAFMIHGTKGHAVLEDQADKYSLLEQAFNKTKCKNCGHIFDPDYTKKQIRCPKCRSTRMEWMQEISGTADALEIEDGKIILVDYKTSGSFKVSKALGIFTEKVPSGEYYKKDGKDGKKGDPKMTTIVSRSDDKIDRKEWELQLNKYRMDFEERPELIREVFMKRFGKIEPWLDRKLKKKNFIDEMKIQIVARDGNTYIANSRGVFRNVYYLHINRIADKKVKEYFTKKKDALVKAMEQGYCNEVCTAEENWDGIKCARYCPVAAHCKLGKYLKRVKESEDMAIKNLSEVRRMPRLGKIRLGIKTSTVKNGKTIEFPKEVDYFILDPETSIEKNKQKLIDDFERLYGKEPKRINIMLPVGEIEKVFPQFYKRYGAGTMLKCKGDGIEAICAQEDFSKGLEVTGQTDMGLPKVVCQGRDCPYYKKKECSEVGTLQVLLPEIEGAGVWQINTGSYHSIVNVNSSLEYIRSMCGRFHMIPLALERKAQEMASDGKKRTHYILSIDMSMKLADLQKQALIDTSKVLIELPETAEDRQDLLIGKTPELDREEYKQKPDKDNVLTAPEE